MDYEGAATQTAADPAEGFRCDAQVGGDHILGHFLEQCGPVFLQFLITLLGCIHQQGCISAGDINV